MSAEVGDVELAGAEDAGAAGNGGTGNGGTPRRARGPVRAVVLAGAGLGARRLGRSLARTWFAGPDRIERRLHVDPHWRRLEDGMAPRLDARTTIAPSKPVGRWRHVDPLQPYDGWRRPWAWAGFGTWVGLTGALALLGWRRRRGPLKGLGHLDEFGSAFDGIWDERGAERWSGGDDGW